MRSLSWKGRLVAGSALLACLWGTIAMLPPPVAPGHPYYAPRDAGVTVIAHRGGWQVGPEETLFQFRRAVELGVDVLEFDVRPTADGVLVALHDGSVDRTTNGSGPVGEMTLAQVQALDAGYTWSAPGQDGHPYRGQGLTIPTLEQVLREFPPIRMLIELKTTDAASAESLCAALQGHDRTDRTIVASVHENSLQTFLQACPEVAVSASSQDMYGYMAWHWLHLDVLAGVDFQAFHVPPSFGPLTVVDRRFVATAQARNLPVEVWTINREEQMEALIDLGVSGIMTARPDLLLGILERRGVRQP